MKGVVIAIDGPSGSGKSTVSRQVARRLELAYLDTGSMYRAATIWCEQCGIDLLDQSAVSQAVQDMPLKMVLDPDSPAVVLAGRDITGELHTPRISQIVSHVAVNLDVRYELRRRQQEIIAGEISRLKTTNFSAGRGIVAEGRDVTSVVAPDADVRILLTASEEARLSRRAKETRGSDDASAIEDTRDEVIRRDAMDSTVSQFMTASDGVTSIDSSDLTIDQVVDAVVRLVRAVHCDPQDTASPHNDKD